MNIKEIIKLKANDVLFGDDWRNVSWKKAYITSFKKYMANDGKMGVLNGGTMKGGNKDLSYKITDTFANYGTNSMLYGKQITPYYKNVILEVFKYYNNQKDIYGNTEIKQQIIRYIHQLFDNKPNISFEELMTAFGAQTVECLIGYFLVAYMTNKLDLILRTMYTFGRVLKLKTKTEWFDNYRLNAYGNVLNMIMWKKYDQKGIFTIDEDPKPINKGVKLSFYPKIVKFLVGSLRAFIIINQLYPRKDEPISGGELVQTSNQNHTMNEKEFSELFDLTDEDRPEFVKNDSLLSNYQIEANESFYSSDVNERIDKDVMERLVGANSNMSDEEICDACYEHYPFYFGGAHGCDVFDMMNMSLSVDELTQFLERYPSAKIGYILNTATYRSGRGQHWVAFELVHKKARLVCSQKSNFNVFDDGGALLNSLKKNGYELEHNDKNIQVDGYACGAYSFVSLMELLRFDDIKKAVERIGVNMSELGKEWNLESSADIVREKVVGW